MKEKLDLIRKHATQFLSKSKNFYFQVNGGFVIIAVLIFVLGWELGHRDYSFAIKNYHPSFKVVNQEPTNKDETIDFKLFWDTWNLVSQKYIDKKALDPKKLYFGAIQGMVAAIGDPYTVFLPPDPQKSTKEQLSGSFDGVGMQLGYDKNKHLVVIAPLKDTPAEKAGVKAGDLILKINSKDATALSLPEAVNVIRGPRGSVVTLELLSENDQKSREVKIIRDTILVKSVDYISKKTTGGKNIAYLRVSSFGEKTTQEWDDAVAQAMTDAPVGVVVDLRNNPGGFLDAAVYLASEFLDGGTVVMEEDGQGQRQNLLVVRSGKLTKLPLEILINKGSASASEIFAGAMQDRKRGILIGDQSFGKGTIQSPQDLAEGTGIHITTGKWLTPNGRWIHNIGLTPEIKVEPGTDITKDLQLIRALDKFDE